MIEGTLVHWEYKTKHVVTLPSTEAEYISLAKGACENGFIGMRLHEVMISRRRQFGWMYNEGNLGAVNLVKNQQVGARTKHMDVNAHFICKLEEQGELTVQFVPSDHNSAEILNKTCPEKQHRNHATRIGGRMLSVSAMMTVHLVLDSLCDSEVGY